MRKHTSHDKYRCIVKSCEEVYYRLDKVRQHLVTAHSSFDDCGCACDGFSSISIPLIMMHVHASEFRHMFNFRTSYSITKPLEYRRSCLVSSCKSTVHIKYMREHLSTHSSLERYNDAQHIREAGYDPKTLDIICPVCQHRTSMLSSFADHIESSHLVTDWEYFKSLKEAYKYCYLASYTLWRREPLHSFNFKKVQETIRNHYLQIEWNSADHHVRYLKDYEELRPHRAMILFHWPEFGDHPIFDDIRQDD
ncbi:hypothetical protein BS50DRAFT_415797 [Corynespora cassiicola Philippines]|uniref:C2H2-type domain-containing protein n=1 Tax=Corynespora cassiicola Philippines TaxID=1448308 RepID=A0A2T2NMI7_CORCC|nr:hypothetical protein BS50DRAFT_415797 [Corynespora cassiicola Philippines]